MGRRKIPQTREEIKAEIDLTEEQIRQMGNREKLYANAYSREERRLFQKSTTLLFFYAKYIFRLPETIF